MRGLMIVVSVALMLTGFGAAIFLMAQNPGTHPVLEKDIRRVEEIVNKHSDETVSWREGVGERLVVLETNLGWNQRILWAIILLLTGNAGISSYTAIKFGRHVKRYYKENRNGNVST